VMSLSSGSEGSGGAAAAGAGLSSFQLASLDDSGSLFVWSLIELSAEGLDPAGSEVDLGLAPGARVKLVRSAVLRDGNFAASAASSKKTSAGSGGSVLGAQGLDVAFKPDASNEFVLSLGRGQLRRGRRYGGKVLPSDYVQHAALAQAVRESAAGGSAPSPSLSLGGVGSGGGDDCTCLAFHPFFPSYFLAGYRSGSVCLFSLDASSALQGWFNLFSSAEGDRMAAGYASSAGGVRGIAWSQQRPSVFMVIDAKGQTIVFDLLSSAQKPVATVALYGSDSASGGAQRPKPLLSVSQTVVGSALALNQSLLAFPSSGSAGVEGAAAVEVHQLKASLAAASEQERRRFAEYLEHVHQL